MAKISRRFINLTIVCYVNDDKRSNYRPIDDHFGRLSIFIASYY